MGNDYNLLIGSHINMSAPEYFLGTCKRAIEYKENTFMFYTGAPQNNIRLPLEKLNIQEGLNLLKSADINIKKVIVHAPYLINLANSLNPNIFAMSIDMLDSEMQRTAGFGCKILVLHPGSHVGAGVEAGLNSLIKGINKVLNINKTNVKIAIETMAGKGSEIGSCFENIKYVLDRVDNKSRVGVCLDTCHINDAGYPIHDVDKVIDTFDRIIGLNNLLVIHLNDSLNPIGAHKDRHANIGHGTIGFDTLLKYAYHPKLENVPKILETPYINEKPPYKEEIEMLRNKKFKEIDN